MISVVAVTVLLGIGPGLVTVLVGDLGVEAFVIGSLWPRLDPSAPGRLAVSLSIGVFVCYVLHAVRVSQQKAQEHAATVVAEVAERRRAEAALCELEAHKRDFYRRTILAATEGKLLVCERQEIEQIAGPAARSWDFRGRDEAAAALDEVTELIREAGMEEQRFYEYLGCITEALANAFKHAGGGRLSLHATDDGLICVVSDSGPGIGTMALPDVALTKHYSTSGTLGMGYKLMIHFADRVYLATGPEGTTVAVEMGLRQSPYGIS